MTDTIVFMPSYQREIESKLQQLTLSARLQATSTGFGTFNANAAESERSAYSFLNMLLLLCATGQSHYEYRGVCRLDSPADVIWCRETIQTYQLQARSGMACMLRDELLGLQRIDLFLSYIQANLAPAAAAQALRVLNDHTILSTIANAAIETPNQPWQVMDIVEAVADALNEDLDIEDTALFTVLLREFNALQRACLLKSA